MTLLNALVGWFMVLALAATQAATPRSAEAVALQRTDRFDYLVRADFFAGIAGDAARLDKAIELCERTLADNPKHAEAMVWHGAALLVRAGQAFQKGDMAAGGPLYDRGLKEMNEAVTLAPDNPGVLVPRGATLLEATRGMPPDMARPLLESAVANYEQVLEVQAPYFNTLGDHAKGELLFGLAEGSARLGRQDRARAYFERLIADAPSSGQAPRAKQWIATGVVPKAAGAANCVGCHK
jgi:tetratricopeptide (TPR) repeat protein